MSAHSAPASWSRPLLFALGVVALLALATLLFTWNRAAPETARAAGPGPGMSLAAPATVFVGVPFVLTVNTAPAPDVEIFGFGSEVVFPAGLKWEQRASCVDELQVGRVDGGAIALCSSFTPVLTGGAAHAVLSEFAIPAAALDVAPGKTTLLLELDFVCNTPGSYKLILTSVPDSPDGAVYGTLLGQEILVKTVPQDYDADGDTIPETHQVADTLTIECSDEPPPTAIPPTVVPTAVPEPTAEPTAVPTPPCPAGGCPPPPCPREGNDGFEALSPPAQIVDTNLIPCWTVVDGGSGSWCLQEGTAPPRGPCSGGFAATVPSPPQGSRAAMTGQSGPGSHVLYRCFDLRASASPANLSFELYLNNFADVFFSPPSLDSTGAPNQQFRADLVTADGITADPFTVASSDVLLNLYQTMPGDAAVSGYSTITADISAFAGQSACLRFSQVDNQLFFHAGVDDVQVPGTDSDRDGCTDEQELGLSPSLGGQRHPYNFWDFFDPNRDRAVTLLDFLAMLARFGAAGDHHIDPLSDPPPPPAYHTRFDRTGAPTGENPWQSGPPDGVIALGDFLALLTQFGHTCT